MDETLLNKLFPFNASAVRLDDERLVCLIHLGKGNKILRASGVRCQWEGTLKFDQWFKTNYRCRIFADGGERYLESREIAVEAA